jgi:hypothetical protein
MTITPPLQMVAFARPSDIVALPRPTLSHISVGKPALVWPHPHECTKRQRVESSVADAEVREMHKTSLSPRSTYAARSPSVLTEHVAWIRDVVEPPLDVLRVPCATAYVRPIVPLTVMHGLYQLAGSAGRRQARAHPLPD